MSWWRASRIPAAWIIFCPASRQQNRRVELPLVVIAHFEGDLLAHEHIYWDQASVLVQVGLLERGNLPITGVEATQKVLEPDRPSNGLMFREWAESEPDRASLTSSSMGAAG
jgi:carboxymethylenebutenolidase